MGLGDVGGEPRGDVVGDHDGGEHVAGLDLRDGLRAGGGRHGFDLVEQLRGVLADVDAAPADFDARAGGGFVDDRDAWLGGAARERQPDQ